MTEKSRHEVCEKKGDWNPALKHSEIFGHEFKATIDREAHFQCLILSCRLL